MLCTQLTENVTDTASIGSSEWLDTSALLSPWKLAATTIEVQFSLKQMGERLAFGTPNRNTKVDRLIAKFMHHHMSTEEADFVAEMARGVGPTIACKVPFFFCSIMFQGGGELILA
jgi:mediator of RNA polymerase II transcription subunit 12